VLHVLGLRVRRRRDVRNVRRASGLTIGRNRGDVLWRARLLRRLRPRRSLAIAKRDQ
jgi:hypothetical protein